MFSSSCYHHCLLLSHSFPQCPSSSPLLFHFTSFLFFIMFLFSCYHHYLLLSHFSPLCSSLHPVISAFTSFSFFILFLYSCYHHSLLLSHSLNLYIHNLSPCFSSSHLLFSLHPIPAFFFSSCSLVSFFVSCPFLLFFIHLFCTFIRHRLASPFLICYFLLIPFMFLFLVFLFVPLLPSSFHARLFVFSTFLFLFFIVLPSIFSFVISFSSHSGFFSFQFPFSSLISFLISCPFLASTFFSFVFL